MKRNEVLKKLSEAGFTFKEGGSHTKAYDSNGVYRTAISRQTEIKKWVVKEIEKQTGVSLLN